MYPQSGLWRCGVATTYPHLEMWRMCDKRFDRLARAHAIGRCSHKGGIPISLRAFCYRSLFDETCKIYLEQNPGVEIVEAERKTFDELTSVNFKLS